MVWGWVGGWGISGVGQNHTFLSIYGVHTVVKAGKSPYIRCRYTVLAKPRYKLSKVVLCLLYILYCHTAVKVLLCLLCCLFIVYCHNAVKVVLCLLCCLFIVYCHNAVKVVLCLLCCLFIVYCHNAVKVVLCLLCCLFIVYCHNAVKVVLCLLCCLFKILPQCCRHKALFIYRFMRFSLIGQNRT